MTTAYCKRLIEVDLPIKRISAHARREKSIRHGHISTLHIWWARRPLAACRAVICASLWPDPADPLCPQVFVAQAAAILKARHGVKGGKVWKWQQPEQLREALLDFIADFADWDNSNDKTYLETARGLTQAAHEAMGGEPGTRPLVVDPFAGGGAIPLEALRVGADAFASDLNPIPVLMNKVVVEYAAKYGRRLAEELRIAAARIRDDVERELAPYYPLDPNGQTPIAYLWARTVRCEGPDCGVEIPLIQSPWLAKRKSRAIAFEITGVQQPRSIKVHVISGVVPSSVGGGTIRKGAAVCPLCGYATPNSSVRAQLGVRRGGASDARLLAVVVANKGGNGRSYRSPTDADLGGFGAACRELDRRKAEHSGDVSLVPDELIPPERPSPNARGLSAVTRMGVKSFGDLYSPRQLLLLTTLARMVSKVGRGDHLDAEFGTAVATCLAFAVDRVAERSCSLARWDSSEKMETIAGTFGRQALAIVWDFAEGVPFRDIAGSWTGAVEWIAMTLDIVADGQAVPGTVRQASATTHPLPDGMASAMVTDPPYYDAVPYADLSDYFYVWLRRSLRAQYPSLFLTELSPKDEEAIWNPGRTYSPTGAPKDESFYERQMQRALKEGLRFTRTDGIGTVVFAHKTTAGWEAILAALLDAGWTATASWPIDTEMGSRVNAQGTASLASSVHIVCRPRTGHDIGNWSDVLRELPVRIREWLPRLAAEGVVGADAIFACLGPALEIFSRYERVEKVSGEAVPLREYLEKVWAAVSKEALAMIFNDPDTAGLGEDARLTAMWLWTLAAPGGDNDSTDDDDASDDDDDEGAAKKAKTAGGFSLEYDAARKIAQGLGCKLESLPHLVEVKGDKARLLPVGERTRHLFGKDAQNQIVAPKPARKKQLTLFSGASPEEEINAAGWGDLQAPAAGITTLDRIHQAMLLFAAGRSEGLKRFLVEDGAGQEVQFWKLAQALSALYPGGTDEKRWVDGVLARKKGLGY